jgi:acetyl esterase/lipase
MRSLLAGIVAMLVLVGCGAAALEQVEATPYGGAADVSAQEDSDSDGAPREPEILQRLDLAYEPPPGVGPGNATLDFYALPAEEARPLALLVHGGSWVGGDKANFATASPTFVRWWLDRGYQVAAVNFRLASPVGTGHEVGPKEQVLDIAFALAWLLQHAPELGIATDGVVALGYSSGAHLVALLGADGTYLEAAGLPEQVLAATVSLDVHAYDVPFARSLMVGSVVEQNIPLIEHLFGATEAEQLAASPIAFVEGWVAPAMLVSVDRSPEEVGSHGYIVSRCAARYAEALRAAGHRVETLHDSDETHASLAIGFGAQGDRVTEAVSAFLDTLP